MELLELVTNFKDIIGVDELTDKATDKFLDIVTDSEKLNDLCGKWIEICPDLETDNMQKIFQYYFADRKEKMQDYTPKSLAYAVAKLSETDDEKVCLDLCAGSGALTIQKWAANNELSFICKEYDKRVIPFLLFNLALRNIRAEVYHMDVLSDEIFTIYRVDKGEKYGIVQGILKGGLKADSCISNPPYNMKWKQPPFAQLQDRFSQCETPPESNANFAFVLTALSEINGKASFILPNGVLKDGTSQEQKIREYLVNSNLIESVILNPNKMFEATDIGTCIITFNKNKTTSKIEMVDLRNKYITEEREQRGQYSGASHTNRTYKKEINVITAEQIQDALARVRERSSVKEYCKSVSIDDVKANKYSLAPPTYIEFDFEKENKHREYSDILSDLNKVIAEKNTCKLTINETIAKSLGFDLELYKQDRLQDKELNDLLERLAGSKIKKHDYFRATKNKNEIKFENNSKEQISSIFMMIFQTWKQHIYYLNNEENRYLAELRDAMLPDLLSGKMEI